MLAQLLEEFSGKVRLVYKDFPLARHTKAQPAAEAARCAGEHEQYWAYHDLLFAAQPAFSRDDLILYAERLSLPRGAFVECLDSGRFRDAVKADEQEGRSQGVTKTPTFFVNGRRVEGARSMIAFREVVREALRQAEGKRP